MRKRGESFTLIELLVVVVVIGILLLLLIPVLRRARRESELKACQENLSQVGRAMYAYEEGGNEYYPFSWMPANEGVPRRKDATTSLGALYPGYMPTADVFRCPATHDRPFFKENLPTGATIPPTALSLPASLWPCPNWTLVNSSYGYDCRVFPTPVANHCIVVDMDGSGGLTQNHQSAQNVVYGDGHVKRVTTNFCSNDPLDNIFAEDAWSADSDSFISDNKSPPRKPGSPADRFNDLGISYDGYKKLWPQ